MKPTHPPRSTPSRRWPFFCANVARASVSVDKRDTLLVHYQYRLPTFALVGGLSACRGGDAWGLRGE